MPERRAGTADLATEVVVLTRSPERNAALASELAARGFRVVEMPCVRIVAADGPRMSGSLAALTEQDLLVLTSGESVAAIAAAIDTACVRADVAAVGPATAAAARAAGMRVSFVPTRADGATLGADLPLPRGEVVLARSDRARRDLPGILRARGARVRELVAYRTVPEPAGDVAAVIAGLERGEAVLVLASPSAVDGLLRGVPRGVVRRARVVAIGAATAAAVRDRIGVTPVSASDPSTEAMARAVEIAARSAVPA